jgi:hypothetical protein
MKLKVQKTLTEKKDMMAHPLRQRDVRFGHRVTLYATPEWINETDVTHSLGYSKHTLIAFLI